MGTKSVPYPAFAVLRPAGALRGHPHIESLSMLTLARLRELLVYDPISGVFRWIARAGRCRAGDIAGCDDGQGYVVIRIDGKPYKAHRLAWLYMTGEWPEDLIDHINGERSENRWANLREASQSQNQANKRVILSSTGHKGVYWSKKKMRFRARVKKDGVIHEVGFFRTADAAHEAYQIAARSLFGEFTNS